MRVCAFITPCLHPIYAHFCAYIVCFPMEDTYKLSKESLYRSSIDLPRGSALRLQEDAGRDDTWEAAPTNLFSELRIDSNLECRVRGRLTKVLGKIGEKTIEK